MNALYDHRRNWRIVHVAGHGEPPNEKDLRGVVLSNGAFLGPREIGAMRVVPELVFVNCCHLAAGDATEFLRDDSSLLYRPYDRARFASGVAAELIKIGVRCVVAAGWAVDDAAAKSFAMAFYDAILRGRYFIDAVAAARKEAWSLGGNTWGAYQCYGDPHWTFQPGVGDAQSPGARPGREFSGIATPQSLVLALDTLATQSGFGNAAPETWQAKVRHLQARFAPRWESRGDVAEAFGKAWVAARDPSSAVEWYEKALAANDGLASIKASEQLGNLRARVAWESLNDAIKKRDEIKQSLAAQRTAGTVSPNMTARLADAEAEVSTAETRSRKSITEAIALLEDLVALKPTMERHSLCGSAYKRRAMIAVACKPKGKNDAIEKMREHYDEAAELGRKQGLGGVFYPLLNYIAADLILGFGKPNWTGLDPEIVAATRQSLAVKCRDEPDFWSVVGITELAAYEALDHRALAGDMKALSAEYDDLRKRVNTGWRWASAYDQMHLVLSRYKKARKTSASERQAADDLLTLLRKFAALK
jgi:tetratricopeptide (TPR) repeat protein